MRKSNLKSTKVNINSISIPKFGYPRIYLFSPTLGYIKVINQDILKKHSEGEDMVIWYRNVHTKDNKFLKYEIHSLHSEHGKWENLKYKVEKL